MIYLDSCALVKFIRVERGTDALRTWRAALPADAELITSELALLEITRALLRRRADHTRVPHYVAQAVKGVHVAGLSTTVLDRARSYRLERLGSLHAIHLTTAEPFRTELADFVTHDGELAAAASSLGLPVTAPA